MDDIPEVTHKGSEQEPFILSEAEALSHSFRDEDMKKFIRTTKDLNREKVVNYLNRFFAFVVNPKKEEKPYLMATYIGGNFSYKAMKESAMMKILKKYSLAEEVEKKRKLKNADGALQAQYETVYTPFWNIWSKDLSQTTFHAIVFDPRRRTNIFRCGADLVLNDWWGYAALQTLRKTQIPDKVLEEALEDLQVIKSHLLDSLLRGEEIFGEYVLNWIAHIIQFPWKKTGVALLFTGFQGVGKTIFWEFFCKALGKHAIYLNQAGDLTEKFGGVLFSEVTVVIADEVDLGSKPKMNTFKTKVTGGELRVEAKCVDIKQHQENFLNFVLTSNDLSCLAVDSGGDMRRFFHVEASNSKLGKKDYWTRLELAFKRNGLAMIMFCKELMRRKISTTDEDGVVTMIFNPDHDRPITEEIQDMQRMKRDVFQSWWVRCLAEKKHISERECYQNIEKDLPKSDPDNKEWMTDGISFSAMYTNFKFYASYDRSALMRQSEFVVRLKQIVPWVEGLNETCEWFSLPSFMECLKFSQKTMALQSSDLVNSSKVIENTKKKRKSEPNKLSRSVKRKQDKFNRLATRNQASIKFFGIRLPSNNNNATTTVPTELNDVGTFQGDEQDKDDLSKRDGKRPEPREDPTEDVSLGKDPEDFSFMLTDAIRADPEYLKVKGTNDEFYFLLHYNNGTVHVRDPDPGGIPQMEMDTN